MDILLIGGGGREHALARRLAESPLCDQLYCLPGNGGIANIAECYPISPVDLGGIEEFCRWKRVDFAVVAQDDPLALGLVDRLHKMGIACFGPTAAAARIESSKTFAKELMEKAHIPTAAWHSWDNVDQALDMAESASYPLVIKADGLALGKGVTIAANREEGVAAVKRAMVERAFGPGGDKLIFEEKLTGPEVSVLCLTDGHVIRPLASSMDHKPVGEGNIGPNTGGMGAVAPNPFYTPDLAQLCQRTIFQPTIEALAEMGCPFKGCLYFGLMLTSEGPKVIEYNCRFGDPETQAVLPLLQGDLVELMLAVEEERLAEVEVVNSPQASCCVVVASEGYPGSYTKGREISGLEAAEAGGALVFQAGTRREGALLLTNGGRVLGVTSVADSLGQAIEQAYAAADLISFEGAFCRRDIGAAALAEIEKEK